MKDHMNRKSDCNVFSQVELTNELKSRILCRQFQATSPKCNEVPLKKENTIETVEKIGTTIINQYLSVYLSVINNQCNILTNPDLVNLTTPLVERLKYGQSKVFDRLSQFEENIENEQHINKSNIYTMTNDITITKDKHKLTDAYYGYDSFTKSYLKRIDDNNLIWEWRHCSFKEIFSEIIEQLIEYVFIPYEIKLNNQYRIDHDSTQLMEFYKINKYLITQPLCCAARHDNQVLFFKTDIEYDEHTGNFDLAEDLNKQFTATFIDTREMMKFRDGIEELIQTNAETTFNMIQDLICGALQCKSYHVLKST